MAPFKTAKGNFSVCHLPLGAGWGGKKFLQFNTILTAHLTFFFNAWKNNSLLAPEKGKPHKHLSTRAFLGHFHTVSHSGQSI